MIRCPNCGMDNQPHAKFCKMCGKPMPMAQPPPHRPPPSVLPPQTRQPTMQPQPWQPPQNQYPQPYQPQPPAPYPQPNFPKPATQVPLSTRLQTAINPTNKFRGVIVDTPSERRDFPPRDSAKLLLGLAILLPFLPILAFVFLTFGIVLCIIAAMGAGMLISCLFIPLGIMTGILNQMRGPQRAEVPILELRAQESNGNIVNIEIIGKRRGGKIALGDEIEADGAWADGQQTTLHAWQVKI